MASKIVTVQDYLMKKDPEKYEPIFKARKEAAEAASGEERKLLDEVSALEEENDKLVEENKKLKAMIAKLKKE